MKEWIGWYKEAILAASFSHNIEPARIAATIWQESNGGVNAQGVFSLGQLYRYEPAFWDHYLAGKTEYGPPPGVSLEAHKHRISASYGLMQVMYATAVSEFNFASEPEALLDPFI